MIKYFNSNIIKLIIISSQNFWIELKRFLKQIYGMNLMGWSISERSWLKVDTVRHGKSGRS